MALMLRWSFGMGAVLCAASLAIAYFYMERHLLLEPCPLCILDRLVVAAIGLVFAVLFFIDGGWRRWLLAINAVLLASGFVFAGRHIWLQNRPPDAAALCLSDNATAQSLWELINRAFDAKGDCGAVYWQFAGFSIPEQVLLLFALFAVLMTLQARALGRSAA